MGEDARDQALGGAVGLTGASDLHCEDVLVVPPQRLGDLELVREEVALGRAQVVGVEPDVAEVEDPVEGDEGATIALEPPAVEPAAVEHGPVRVREPGGRAPVTRDGDVLPRGVVERALDEPLVQVTLGDLRAPRAREVVRAGLGAQVGFFAALARCDVTPGWVAPGWVAPGWVTSPADGAVGGWGGGGGLLLPVEADSPDCRSSSFWIARCSHRFTQSLPLKNTLAPCNTSPSPQNTVAHRKSQPTAARKMTLSTTKKNRCT